MKAKVRVSSSYSSGDDVCAGVGTWGGKRGGLLSVLNDMNVFFNPALMPRRYYATTMSRILGYIEWRIPSPIAPALALFSFPKVAQTQ